MLDIAAICLVVTALLAYLNHRFIRLPTAIGVMAIALGISLSMFGLDTLRLDHGLRRYEESFLRSIDFSDVMMQGISAADRRPRARCNPALGHGRRLRHVGGAPSHRRQALIVVLPAFRGADLADRSDRC